MRGHTGGLCPRAMAGADLFFSFFFSRPPVFVNPRLMFLSASARARRRGSARWRWNAAVSAASSRSKLRHPSHAASPSPSSPPSTRNLPCRLKEESYGGSARNGRRRAARDSKQQDSPLDRKCVTRRTRFNRIFLLLDGERGIIIDLLSFVT